jgi:predicted nucleotidyltransferase component of viral defense system
MNEQSLKERIKNISQQEKRTFNDIWRELTLERLLVRVSKSELADKFIFKGGLLLSRYLELGRETKDADFLLTQINASRSSIENAFRTICQLEINDGFTFTYEDIVPLEQPHMNYPGFRVTMKLFFGEKMRDKIQVDIGIGDIVNPKIEILKLYHYKDKPFFEGSVSLRVYPIETIFAEKLETIISKGAANSRMKDFHDLLLIIREEGLLNTLKLHDDIFKTFSYRKTEKIIPISFTPDNYLKMQPLWINHCRGFAINLFLQILNNIVDSFVIASFINI